MLTKHFRGHGKKAGLTYFLLRLTYITAEKSFCVKKLISAKTHNCEDSAMIKNIIY